MTLIVPLLIFTVNPLWSPCDNSAPANTFNKFDPGSPFGGYKESGIGREGGLQGLAPYLDLH